jgi:hypothetical protein
MAAGLTRLSLPPISTLARWMDASEQTVSLNFWKRLRPQYRKKDKISN